MPIRIEVLCVSVNHTYHPTMTLQDLEPGVRRSWRITPSKALDNDFVVAIYTGLPVAMWPLEDAYKSRTDRWSDNPESNHYGRMRTNLVLGAAMPVHPEVQEWIATNALSMRAGLATVTIDFLLDPIPEV